MPNIIPNCSKYNMATCKLVAIVGDLIVSQAKSLIICVAATVMTQQGLSHQIPVTYIIRIISKVNIIIPVKEPKSDL